MAETDGKFAIHEAAREGRLQVVESLLKDNPRLATRVDDDDRTPLHWACAYNHLSIVTLLCTVNPRSFDPDVADGSGWTPLMMAASLKENAGLPVIQLLLSKEADPKISANNGATALHFASSKNNLDVVKTLLGAGASARVKDRRGQMPLHRAASVGAGPIVRLLLREGKAPVNAEDVDRMTALHHAVSEGHGDVAVELLKRGAEPDKLDMDERTAIDCAPDAKVRSYILRAAEREGIDL